MPSLTIIYNKNYALKGTFLVKFSIIYSFPDSIYYLEFTQIIVSNININETDRNVLNINHYLSILITYYIFVVINKFIN